MAACVQQARFDVAALAEQLRAATQGRAGAYVHFVGTVRDYRPDAASRSLFLEHYPGMCEREIDSICREAGMHWQILDTLVVHRVGELPLAEPIVFVGVAAAHREPAFRACEYIIDALKTRAPFWKRERLSDGQVFWVQQQSADVRKAAGWNQQAAAPTAPDDGPSSADG